MKDLFLEIAADFSENGVFVMRMILASVCGAIIGVERGKRQKDAGIRTHIIVAMSSALLMIISKYGFFDVLVNEGIKVDAARIASNIITGVSFLGAGVIFVKDVSIKGLTTAAGICCTCAIGMAMGAGLYTIGICATLMMIMFQLVLHRFFDRLENTTSEVTVVIRDNENAMQSFDNLLKENKITITNCKMKRDPENQTMTFVLDLKKPRTMAVNQLMTKVQLDDNILSVEG